MKVKVVGGPWDGKEVELGRHRAIDGKPMKLARKPNTHLWQGADPDTSTEDPKFDIYHIKVVEKGGHRDVSLHYVRAE